MGGTVNREVSWIEANDVTPDLAENVSQPVVTKSQKEEVVNTFISIAVQQQLWRAARPSISSFHSKLDAFRSTFGN